LVACATSRGNGVDSVTLGTGLHVIMSLPTCIG
jgi:hypothetical protein